MCIILSYHDNQPDARYKLVIAANRDEYWKRPSLPADFHPLYPELLCGVDMKPGLEGGTWMGVSKAGKFSAIANHAYDYLDHGKLRRGTLVIDYLRGRKEPLPFLDDLQDSDHKGFNLLTGYLDLNNNVEIGFYSNRNDAPPKLLREGMNVISGGEINGEWKKVQYGRAKFATVLEKSNYLTKDRFTERLFSTLLSDKKGLYPDVALEKDCGNSMGDEILRKYCSIQIAGLPEYGTRAQTVFLIDKNNVVHYTERSLKYPPEEDIWMKKSYQFAISGC